jgi:hypothetical protein
MRIAFPKENKKTDNQQQGDQAQGQQHQVDIHSIPRATRHCYDNRAVCIRDDIGHRRNIRNG